MVSNAIDLAWARPERATADREVGKLKRQLTNQEHMASRPGMLQQMYGGGEGAGPQIGSAGPLPVGCR